MLNITCYVHCINGNNAVTRESRNVLYTSDNVMAGQRNGVSRILMFSQNFR